MPHAWISFPNPLLQDTKSVKRSSLLPFEPVDVSYVTELDEQQIRACQWSTLDLCGPDSFTMILAAEDTQSNPQVAQFQKHCEAIGVPLRTWYLDADFEVVRQAWFAAELNRIGGILVRPDQHILMMVTEKTTGDDMVAALSSHFGAGKTK